MYRRAIFPYCAIGSTRFDLKKKIILFVGCCWSHLKVEIAAGIALNWKSMNRVRKFYSFRVCQCLRVVALGAWFIQRKLFMIVVEKDCGEHARGKRALIF